MINNKMYELGSKRSVIREIFEYGNKRRAVVGEDSVYDFSLGNPNVDAPVCLEEAIITLASKKNIHAYTSAQGALNVRETLANYLNKKHETNFNADNFYMTVGAAASLCATLNALCNEGDEVIVIAPFFTEYRVFVESANAKLIIVEPNLNDFQIDFNSLINKINKNTKALIINSPNNPSGVVYSEEVIIKLAKVLNEKSNEYGNPIFLISDEPYREIVYGGIKVPFVTKYYNNTIVCYSYSKSLSLPGERIGYVLVPNEVTNSKEVYLAVCGAGRSLGYVCAPALFQQVIAMCIDKTSDMSIYENNRNLLYDGLSNLGFSCVKPQGAFYLFLKSPISDANEFAKKAMEYDILVVPSDDFGVKGYVRLAYCVKTKTIIDSMSAFKKLMSNYK